MGGPPYDTTVVRHLGSVARHCVARHLEVSYDTTVVTTPPQVSYDTTVVTTLQVSYDTTVVRHLQVSYSGPPIFL